MNRRSLLLGTVAMAAVSACSGLAPAAQDQIYPLSALRSLWKENGPIMAYATETCETRRDHLIAHLDNIGIKLPAYFEGPAGGKGVHVLGLFITDDDHGQRMLHVAFDYPGDRNETPGPHTMLLMIQPPPVPNKRAAPSKSFLHAQP